MRLPVGVNPAGPLAGDDEVAPGAEARVRMLRQAAGEQVHGQARGG
jgi:hypothetical protein